MPPSSPSPHPRNRLLCIMPPPHGRPEPIGTSLGASDALLLRPNEASRPAMPPRHLVRSSPGRRESVQRDLISRPTPSPRDRDDLSALEVDRNGGIAYCARPGEKLGESNRIKRTPPIDSFKNRTDGIPNGNRAVSSENAAEGSSGHARAMNPDHGAEHLERDRSNNGGLGFGGHEFGNLGFAAIGGQVGEGK